MNIDTEHCQQMASAFRMWQKSFYFGIEELDRRHSQIIFQLQRLETYFTNIAKDAEQVEIQLQPSHSFYKKTYQSFTPVSNYLGSNSAYRAGASLRYYAYHSSRHNEHASMTSNVGNFIASASCTAALFKEKQWNPQIRVQAKSEVSLLHTKVNASLGGKYVSLHASGSAKVGVATAQAKAVFSESEQSFKFHVGASALEGQAQCAFKILKTTVTLTGSKSIGTAEFDVEYSHKNKEWEFGSKLGFIAGLGFKVNVKYG